MLKYIGRGAVPGGSVPGIPARDLSDKEVKKYGGIELLLSTGLYAEVLYEPVPGTEWEPKEQVKEEGE